MNVQVILNEDLPNLGGTGDVVKVRAGYARNYLLPRGLAAEANARNVRAFDHQKRAAALKREARTGLSVALKARLEALALTLTANAGEEGRLFGSVTNIDIERALRERGLVIDRRRIMLVDPIKQLGEYTVAVRLDSGVEAGLKVFVTAQ